MMIRSVDSFAYFIKGIPHLLFCIYCIITRFPLEWKRKHVFEVIYKCLIQ